MVEQSQSTEVLASGYLFDASIYSEACLSILSNPDRGNVKYSNHSSVPVAARSKKARCLLNPDPAVEFVDSYVILVTITEYVSGIFRLTTRITDARRDVLDD